MTTEQLRAALEATRIQAIENAEQIPAPFRPVVLAFITTIDQVAGAIVDNQGELERRIAELEACAKFHGWKP